MESIRPICLASGQTTSRDLGEFENFTLNTGGHYLVDMMDSSLSRLRGSYLRIRVHIIPVEHYVS